MSFARAYAFIARPDVEGGDHTDPTDPGGETNGGIAAAYHPELAGQIATLTAAQKQQTIHDGYWLTIRGDVLPEYLGIPMLSISVLDGPEDAIKALQTAARVPADGLFGNTTLHAVCVADEGDLLSRLTGLWLVTLSKRSGWPRNGDGWSVRAARAVVETLKPQGVIP